MNFFLCEAKQKLKLFIMTNDMIEKNMKSKKIWRDCIICTVIKNLWNEENEIKWIHYVYKKRI